MNSVSVFIEFLEAHIDLVKALAYFIAPLFAICFKDIRSVVVKFLNGIYFIFAMIVKIFWRRYKRYKLFSRFIEEIYSLPETTRALVFRFGAEGQYIEIHDIKKAVRDIRILHDKGWIHGMHDITPYVICIDIRLLPYVKKLTHKYKSK